MQAFDPKKLAAWTGGRWSAQPKEAPNGFCVDSRRLLPGQAFIALKTDKRDGHDFLGEALKAGAGAAVVARFNPGVGLAQLVVGDPLSALQAIAREHRKQFKGTVIAITGSAGKTSTKELLALLLGGEAAGVLSTEANLNNQIGVALTLSRIDPTRHRVAVVEAGISAPGEMKLLASMIGADVAIVTLVAPAHLEELGGMEAVAREKAVLAGSIRKGGVALFPASCDAFAAFRGLRRSRCIVLDPVEEVGDAVRVPGRIPFSVSHLGDRTAIVLSFGDEPQVFALRRVSDGMAQNAAIAVYTAIRIGVENENVRSRILSWNPPPLRGEWRFSEGRRIYLDCYNANPASMADALAAFDAVAPGDEPRLFVIGCMEELGGESRRYHVELGRSLALRKGDQLVAVGTLAGAIRDGALERGCDPEQILISDSIGPLVERLSAFRGSLFVKGSRRHGLERAFAGKEFAESAHA